MKELARTTLAVTSLSISGALMAGVIVFTAIADALVEDREF